MQCRRIGSHLAASGKSHFFSRIAVGTWGIFSSYGGDDTSKLVFVPCGLESCLVTRETSRISSRLGRAIQTHLEVRREKQCTFLVATMILGFLSIFNKSRHRHILKHCTPHAFLVSKGCEASCPDEAGPSTFSRVSTGNSEIPSPCEMKAEPAFKPFQGNPAFFRVRASQCAFHLRQQTQGPSHIPITQGSIRFRYFWKVGVTLQSEPGNQLSSQDHMGCTEHSLSCCAEIGVPLDLRCLSQGISGVA